MDEIDGVGDFTEDNAEGDGKEPGDVAGLQSHDVNEGGEGEAAGGSFDQPVAGIDGRGKQAVDGRDDVDSVIHAGESEREGGEFEEGADENGEPDLMGSALEEESGGHADGKFKKARERIDVNDPGGGDGPGFCGVVDGELSILGEDGGGDGDDEGEGKNEPPGFFPLPDEEGEEEIEADLGRDSPGDGIEGEENVAEGNPGMDEREVQESEAEAGVAGWELGGVPEDEPKEGKGGKVGGLDAGEAGEPEAAAGLPGIKRWVDVNEDEARENEEEGDGLHKGKGGRDISWNSKEADGVVDDNHGGCEEAQRGESVKLVDGVLGHSVARITCVRKRSHHDMKALNRRGRGGCPGRS